MPPKCAPAIRSLYGDARPSLEDRAFGEKAGLVGGEGGASVR
jgi:hypothetical protein